MSRTIELLHEALVAQSAELTDRCAELAAAKQLDVNRVLQLETALARAETLDAELAAAKDALWQHTEAAKQSLKEKEALRTELAAETRAKETATTELADWLKAEAEFNAERVAKEKVLRAELSARDELLLDALSKLQPIAALVDMTPDGFPDHDLCPIRLWMARGLRELRARVDSAMKGRASDG